MTDAPAPLPSAPPPRTPGTVRDVMRPKAATVEPNDHVAAAAYLMKHAGATALVIVDAVTGQPAGIITETDITHAVAAHRNASAWGGGRQLTVVPAGDLANRYWDMYAKRDRAEDEVA